MGLVNLDASGTESDGANDNGVDEDGRRQLSVASGRGRFLPADHSHSFWYLSRPVDAASD